MKNVSVMVRTDRLVADLNGVPDERISEELRGLRRTALDEVSLRSNFLFAATLFGFLFVGLVMVVPRISSRFLLCTVFVAIFITFGSCAFLIAFRSWCFSPVIELSGEAYEELKRIEVRGCVTPCRA